MKTLPEFIDTLRKVQTANSISGSAQYIDIKIEYNKIFYTRQSSSNRESLHLDELFRVYENEPFINTQVVQKHISGYKYSPTCAILSAAGFYDQKGKRNK